MNSGFKTHFVFYGFQYYSVKNPAFYFEGRIENSKNVNGEKVPGAI